MSPSYLHTGGRPAVDEMVFFISSGRGVNPSYPGACKVHHAGNSRLDPSGVCLALQEVSRLMDWIRLVGLVCRPSPPTCLSSQIKRQPERLFFIATPTLPPLPFPRFRVASHGLRGRHLPDRGGLIFCPRSPCCQ